MERDFQVLEISHRVFKNQKMFFRERELCEKSGIRYLVGESIEERMLDLKLALNSASFVPRESNREGERERERARLKSTVHNYLELLN